MLPKRLTNAAFGAGWTLVYRMPESWARAAFMLGADVTWHRQGHAVQVLEGNLGRVIGQDAGRRELRTLSPEDWHMLQRVFVADLDAERLKATRNT